MVYVYEFTLAVTGKDVQPCLCYLVAFSWCDDYLDSLSKGTDWQCDIILGTEILQHKKGNVNTQEIFQYFPWCLLITSDMKLLVPSDFTALLL